MFVLSSCAYKNTCCLFVTGGFQYTNPFCLGEDEEVEIDLQEDFFSFEVDLVAEQLTYMDAVREKAIYRTEALNCNVKKKICKK